MKFVRYYMKKSGEKMEDVREPYGFPLSQRELIENYWPPAIDSNDKTPDPWATPHSEVIWE